MTHLTLPQGAPSADLLRSDSLTVHTLLAAGAPLRHRLSPPPRDSTARRRALEVPGVALHEGEAVHLPDPHVPRGGRLVPARGA